MAAIFAVLFSIWHGVSIQMPDKRPGIKSSIRICRIPDRLIPKDDEVANAFKIGQDFYMNQHSPRTCHGSIKTTFSCTTVPGQTAYVLVRQSVMREK